MAGGLASEHRKARPRSAAFAADASSGASKVVKSQKPTSRPLIWIKERGTEAGHLGAHARLIRQTGFEQGVSHDP